MDNRIIHDLIRKQVQRIEGEIKRNLFIGVDPASTGGDSTSTCVVSTDGKTDSLSIEDIKTAFAKVRAVHNPEVDEVWINPYTLKWMKGKYSMGAGDIGEPKGSMGVLYGFPFKSIPFHPKSVIMGVEYESESVQEHVTLFLEGQGRTYGASVLKLRKPKIVFRYKLTPEELEEVNAIEEESQS